MKSSVTMTSRLTIAYFASINLWVSSTSMPAPRDREFGTLHMLSIVSFR